MVLGGGMCHRLRPIGRKLATNSLIGVPRYERIYPRAVESVQAGTNMSEKSTVATSFKYGLDADC